MHAPDTECIAKGKTRQPYELGWLKRRQAVEPAIAHLKHNNRISRFWLAGKLGDALHAVLCAAGFNLRWLMMAAAHGAIKWLSFIFSRSWTSLLDGQIGCGVSKLPDSTLTWLMPRWVRRQGIVRADALAGSGGAKPDFARPTTYIHTYSE